MLKHFAAVAGLSIGLALGAAAPAHAMTPPNVRAHMTVTVVAPEFNGSPIPHIMGFAGRWQVGARPNLAAFRGLGCGTYTLQVWISDQQMRLTANHIAAGIVQGHLTLHSETLVVRSCSNRHAK